MSARKRFWILAALIALIPGAAIAWWLGSPLFLDRTVDEEFPVTAAAVVTPANVTPAEAEAAMATMAKIDQEMSEEMPQEMMSAEAVKAGDFRGADAFHQGSGRATIYRLEDGSHVLRFEDFQVTNGPDLRVLLVGHPDPGSRDDVMARGHVELGKLKGNIGNQNYEIPTDTDIDAQRSVVIYCKPFKVVFSVAPLG